MRKISTSLIGLTMALTFTVPATATSQQLITPGSVGEFDWPSPDAQISYGDDQFQFGYLRLPEGSGPHPVIVFMHGGCWLSVFDIRYTGLAEQAFADAGYAVWSLEYRRVGNPGGGWPGTFLDVATGADHLTELAREYPLDLDRVIAIGHSAGGQLALWLAARGRIPTSSELYTAGPLPIHGVLALAPAPNLETLHSSGSCGPGVDGLMGGSPNVRPERYQVGSPMQLMPVDVPQRVVVGALDAQFGPSGRAYSQAAQRAGSSSVTLREAPESGHFEMVVPYTSTWPITLQELESLSVEMTQARNR
ncbi:MAG: alpha/beta hydrolase [Acidimicrobiales bacterium]|nr:alpha/beta hydrolase [Acidimicrobiales bacterium]